MVMMLRNDEGGYVEMKREYIKPEAELTKFVETEELMTVTTNLESNWNGMTFGAGAMPDGVTWQ